MRSDSVGCHIVVARAGDPHAETAPTCHTLSAGELNEVRSAILGARGGDAYIARALRHVAVRYGMSGLALVIPEAHAGHWSPPAPLVVPFEPIELDENHPTLAGLWAGAGAVIESSRPKPAPSRFQRWFIRRILPAAAILYGAVYSLLDSGPPKNVLEALAIVAVGALIMAGILGVRWLSSGKWFVVPGGVAIWGFELRRLSQTPRLYTPADTILILRRLTGRWQVELYRSYRGLHRELTDLEAAVLLAAWQSVVPRPNLDEFLQTRA